MESVILGCLAIVESAQYALNKSNDPFVETNEFENCPIKSLINDGMIRFFLRDGFGDEKRHFVSMILDGSYGLLNDGDTRQFVIKDYQGKERRCELRKTEDTHAQLGIELVEIDPPSLLPNLLKKSNHVQSTEVISTVDPDTAKIVSDAIQVATLMVKQKFVFGNCQTDGAFAHMLAEDKLFQLRIAYQLFRHINDYDYSLFSGALWHLANNKEDAINEMDCTNSFANALEYRLYANKNDIDSKDIGKSYIKYAISHPVYFCHDFIDSIIRYVTSGMHTLPADFVNPLITRVVLHLDSYSWQSSRLAAEYIFINAHAFSQVKDALKVAVIFIVNNARNLEKKDIVWHTAGYVMSHPTSFSDAVIKNAIEHLMCNVNSVNYDYLKMATEYAINHPNVPSQKAYGVAIKLLKHFVATFEPELIQTALRTSLDKRAKVSHDASIETIVEAIIKCPADFSNNTVQLAVACIARDIDQFRPDLFELAIRYALDHTDSFSPIVGVALAITHLIKNSSQYDATLVLDGAKFVVKNYANFSREAVMLGIDWLVNANELNDELVVKAAQAIISKNERFFNDAIDNHSQFEKFFSEKEMLDSIGGYSLEFKKVLDASPVRVMIFWFDRNEPTVVHMARHQRENHVKPHFIRRFFLLPRVKQKEKQEEKIERTLQFALDKKWKEFFTDEKKKDRDFAPVQMINVRSLWVQKDFVPALHANKKVADYLIKERKHRALEEYAQKT